jgi:prolyl-tRNA synthetase
MIMVHGDDKGLRMPPKVAPIQVVLVPIYSKTNHATIDAQAKSIVATLTAAGIRAESDLRQNYKPGWKYNHWETKGVPIRMELGERDIASSSVVLVRRDSGVKSSAPMAALVSEIQQLMASIHQSMYDRAVAAMEAHKKRADTYAEFITLLNQRNVVLVPFCLTHECEDDVKTRSGNDTKAMASDENFGLTGSAKSLCVPFDQPELKAGVSCFAGCGRQAKAFCLFGRSY